MNLRYMAYHTVQRGFGVGQGQKVVQKGPVVGGPCEMFGKGRRFDLITELSETRQMGGVQAAFGTDGKAYAVD